ncbi:hypothetical protein V7O62_11805 [Methanolobus sp. ZRKC2]|uniref:hypothetical protein n=1 Tax=Methanolobus sp. ZRKC2 TaxID=3125783 RepID=UPI00324E9955
MSVVVDWSTGENDVQENVTGAEMYGALPLSNMIVISLEVLISTISELIFMRVTRSNESAVKLPILT